MADNSPTTSNDKPVSTDTITGEAGTHLSQQIFHNPKDFLYVLRDHFAEIDKNHTGLTQIELQDAARHNADPTVRAAAQIAADYFDDLANLTNLDKSHPVKSISQDNLGYDLSLLNDPKGQILLREIADGYYAGIYGLGSAAVGGGAFVTAEIPPLAIGLGIASAGMAVGAGYLIHDMTGAPGEIRAQTAQETAILSAIPEINDKK